MQSAHERFVPVAAIANATGAPLPLVLDAVREELAAHVGPHDVSRIVDTILRRIAARTTEVACEPESNVLDEVPIRERAPSFHPTHFLVVRGECIQVMRHGTSYATRADFDRGLAPRFTCIARSRWLERDERTGARVAVDVEVVDFDASS